jgi:SAM-dependent methyltransferase
MTETPDWEGWLRRWEAQQSLYLPEREPRFRVITDVLRAMVGDAPTVIDLGSGPGSLASRILDRLPHAHVVAVDADPLLLELGRQTLGTRGGHVRWVDCDLRDAKIADRLELNQPADAAVSTTALHWLSREELVGLFGRLAQILRPGGVFINGDHLSFDQDQGRIASAVKRLREERAAAPRDPSVETWTEWWAAIEADPALAGLVAERRSRWGGHHDHHAPGEATFMSSALEQSGFAEVGTVWQELDDRVLVAILGDAAMDP